MKVDQTGNSEFASLNNTHPRDQLYTSNKLRLKPKKINESVEDWHTVEACHSAAQQFDVYRCVWECGKNYFKNFDFFLFKMNFFYIFIVLMCWY